MGQTVTPQRRCEHRLGETPTQSTHTNITSCWTNHVSQLMVKLINIQRTPYRETALMLPDTYLVDMYGELQWCSSHSNNAPHSACTAHKPLGSGRATMCWRCKKRASTSPRSMGGPFKWLLPVTRESQAHAATSVSRKHWLRVLKAGRHWWSRDNQLILKTVS